MSSHCDVTTFDANSNVASFVPVKCHAELLTCLVDETVVYGH